jgi:hypothetical protein
MRRTIRKYRSLLRTTSGRERVEQIACRFGSPYRDCGDSHSTPARHSESQREGRSASREASAHSPPLRVDCSAETDDYDPTVGDNYVPSDAGGTPVEATSVDRVSVGK